MWSSIFILFSILQQVYTYTWADACTGVKTISVGLGLSGVSYPDPTGPSLFDQKNKTCTIRFVAENAVVMHISIIGTITCDVATPRFPTLMLEGRSNYTLAPSGNEYTVTIDGYATWMNNNNGKLGFLVSSVQADANIVPVKVLGDSGSYALLAVGTKSNPNSASYSIAADGQLRDIVLFVTYYKQQQPIPNERIMFFDSQMNYIASAADYYVLQGTSNSVPYISNMSIVSVFYDSFPGFEAQILACSYYIKGNVNYMNYNSLAWDAMDNYLMDSTVKTQRFIVVTRKDDDKVNAYIDVLWQDKSASFLVFNGCAGISNTGAEVYGTPYIQAGASVNATFPTTIMPLPVYTLLISNGRALVTLSTKPKGGLTNSTTTTSTTRTTSPKTTSPSKITNKPVTQPVVITTKPPILTTKTTKNNGFTIKIGNTTPRSIPITTSVASIYRLSCNLLAICIVNLYFFVSFL